MVNLNYLDDIRKTAVKLQNKNPELLGRYNDSFLMEYVYNSSKIYGCCLTLEETITFLLNGSLSEGKDILDYIIPENIYNSIIWFDNKINSNYPVDLEIVSELNRQLLTGMNKYFVTVAGKKISRRIYKGILKDEIPNQFIADPDPDPATTAKSIRKQVESLLWEIHYQNTFTIDNIANIFYTFLNIKPFEIGNGRISRILINHILDKSKYTPIIFKIEDKEEFEASIKDADNGNFERLTQMIYDKVIESYQRKIEYFQNLNR
jgi:Fic family protein